MIISFFPHMETNAQRGYIVFQDYTARKWKRLDLNPQG